jgi:DNA-binding NarL/FixJ family response regulator
MISAGLRRHIEIFLGYKDINSVTSCSKILFELKSKEYTHLILDIGLSDGSALEIFPTIRQLHPRLHIMVFSAKPAAAYEKALKKYHIHYYLSKEADEEETITVLRKFFKNEPLLPVREAIENPFSRLSPRELEVLAYLLQGKGPNEIGAILNLAPSTVTEFKNRIHRKTETDNVATLINLAIAFNVT